MNWTDSADLSTADDKRNGKAYQFRVHDGGKAERRYMLRTTNDWGRWGLIGNFEDRAAAKTACEEF